MRFHVVLVQIVKVMPTPLPQDLRPLGIPTAAPPPAVAEMGHDRQRRVRAPRHVDDPCHACDCYFVEDVVGRVDCGEDDPFSEEAAGDVVEVGPAGAELVAFDTEVLAKTVVDFAGGVGSRALGSSVEPEPVAHDLVPGLFSHAEIFRAVHVREPYVFEILVSKRHWVEPYVEMEEENAVYLRGAIIDRCVEYQLHGVSEGFVCGKGLLERIMGEIQLVLVRSEVGHADVYLSEEGFVRHYRWYPFRAICVDSNEGHAVFKR